MFKILHFKTGIPVHAHLFRHTHATIFYQQTKNPKQLQDRLGHAQIQTALNMYVHPTEEELRENWQRAQDAFNVTNEDI
jgi:integrase